MKQLLFLFFFVGLACCSASSFADDNVIEIGWIGPLSGPAAVLGVDTVPAIRMGFDDAAVPGAPSFRLVVEDDRYETVETLRAYERLVHQRGIKVLFVLTYGGIFALADQAAKDGVLLLDTLDCDEEIAKLPSNVICIAKTTEDLGRQLAEEAKARGDVPAAIIHFDSDPFMGTVARVSSERLSALGSPAVFVDPYPSGTTDFRGMLLRAKSKRVRSLFLLGYDETSYAIRQARELGLDVQFYATNTVTSPAFRKAAGKAAEGILAASYRAPRGPRFDKFLAEFKKRTGNEPTFEVSAIPSYDTAVLVARAFAENRRSADSIQSFFLGVRGYQGLSGTVSVDSDGAVRSIQGEVFELQSGDLRKIG